MGDPKITDLTLGELNAEIDRITNFELNGGGYGAPEAREADDRKLRILMHLREQKLMSIRHERTLISSSQEGDEELLATTIRLCNHCGNVTSQTLAHRHNALMLFDTIDNEPILDQRGHSRRKVRL